MNDEHPPDIYALMNRRLVPYGVSLEITARCNLDCVHCYHVRCRGKELDTGEIEEVLDALAALGTMELTLTGGEPLLRDDFPDILRCAVRETGFSVKLFSNLTLLTPETADLLASLPLNSVETTILGPDAATHDALTGRPGSFDAVIGAIEMLVERGVRCSAKTIVMKPNLAGLKAMYRLAEGLGIPFCHDDGVFVESNGRRSPLSLQIPDEEITRLRRRTGGGTGSLPGVCNIGKSVMSIAPDGSVYPCGPFPERAGDVRETPLAEIWRDSPVMNRVRGIRNGDYIVCQECYYFERCNGCVAMGLGLSSGRIYPCRLARKRLRNLT